MPQTRLLVAVASMSQLLFARLSTLRCNVFADFSLFRFHSFVNCWSGEFVQLFSFTTPHPTPFTPASQLAFALVCQFAHSSDLQDGSWIREDEEAPVNRGTSKLITWCFVLSSF